MGKKSSKKKKQKKKQRAAERKEQQNLLVPTDGQILEHPKNPELGATNGNEVAHTKKSDAESSAGEQKKDKKSFLKKLSAPNPAGVQENDKISQGKFSQQKFEKEKSELAFEEKIQLEKNSHTYFSALQRKYGKHVKKVEGPAKKFLKFFAFIILLGVLFIAALFLTFGRDLPDVRQLKDINFAATTHIYDRNGHELYSIVDKDHPEYREYVDLSQISPYAIHGTIAIEDKNFYHHFGFDPVGMVRAELQNIKSEAISQGASTITQQLARNVFLSREQTYDRKIKEILLSLEIELNFSKDDILEMYFNKIPYGSNAFGIEAASQTFFGVHAQDLSLVQASVLASLPKAPSLYSPYGPNVKSLMGYCNVDAESSDEMVGTMEAITKQGGDQPVTIDDQNGTEEIVPGNQQNNAQQPQETTTKTQQTVPKTSASTHGKVTCSSPSDPNYVWGRKDYVLQRMVEDRYITKDEMQQAWKEGLTLKFIDPKHPIEDPHFVFFVKDYLTQKYGKEMVENGGLQVITTLDPHVQSVAEQAIQDHTDLIHRYGADNAAMVALDPQNGQILAMVGSRDYTDQKIDGQVNVTISPRQPGSSFKPLVYAAAIQNAGIGSGTYLDDSKTIFNKNDQPNDYDGNFLGHITIRQAIGGSRNIPAIKAFYVAGGEDKVLDFVDKLGVTNLRQFRDDFNKDATKRGWTFFFGWPMAIGSGEVRLLDLVGAYATFANQGKYNEPNPILEVRDRNGVVLESFRNPSQNGGKQVIDPQIAYIISDILSDVSVRPPGSWRGLLTIPGQNLADKTGTSNKTIRGRELPNNNITVGYTPSIAAGFWVGNTDGKALISNAYSLYTTDPIFHQFFETILKDKPREDFPKPAGIKQVGREYYPSWGGPKSFESMFKRVSDTQQKAADIPLPDFLNKSPADIKAYQNTLKQLQLQQQQQAAGVQN